jgi:hypothetical protein
MNEFERARHETVRYHEALYSTAGLGQAGTWLARPHRLWREDRISALLSSSPDDLPGVLFVQGTARNQGLFYPRFDHVVLLSAPPEILAERLATRAGNPYGKDPAELAETLRYKQTVQPLLRASATLEVVTTVPVAQVADIVLDHVL